MAKAAQKVSNEHAQMLAAHAIYVQHGFSTPEVEKARAEKDIANGAVIDWDKIQAEVTAAMIAGLEGQEAEAAEFEGLVQMPADLVPLREEKLKLDKQLEKLQARKKEIQDEFGQRLKDDGMVGYLLHGKVHARRKQGTRTGVDVKRLKDELPLVYKNYLKVTDYVQITVN